MHQKMKIRLSLLCYNILMPNIYFNQKGVSLIFSILISSYNNNEKKSNHKKKKL